MNNDLFASDEGIALLDNNGAVTYWPNLLPSEQADALLKELLQNSYWQQEQIQMYGQQHQQPRLTCWYGSYGVSAASGYRQLTQPQPFSPGLLALKECIETRTGYRYNSVLANLYRDGRDSVGYHADDEAILGDRPTIASYSLGATRRFLLKHRRGEANNLGIDLPHNSLLLMTAPLQQHWQHAIGKTRRPVGERINLTFRWLQPGYNR
ncbi:alkylated DNA repair dioxygenase AlkB [Sinobacterium caligoides]|uniref:Alkylated DNA repair dioxygenase AlkB n=1 Tax=Sinobacterium caligoides TaxID=933926 RepID=A0A3N2DPX3_9GAMM|nr:alpha-ketoglutarate-dependent dioxygenase AlkB [Sinobacterium caligoides]ROS01830.1 alkylated DNA repair dioxygenase AlkB [Sinobacterium caligoides]